MDKLALEKRHWYRENIGTCEEDGIIIDQDELRTKFPSDKYKIIHDHYTERQEFIVLKPYIKKLVRELAQQAQRCGYNIILESALRKPASFAKLIQEAKQKSGYRTKLSVLAVPQMEAGISMLTRYCYYLERDGECRRNTRLEDSGIQKLRTNLDTLTNSEIFDEITISVRGDGMDSLPKERYSQRANNNLTPLQAYDAEIQKETSISARNFALKYEHIKQILLDYGEQEQLGKLEQIKQFFENERDGIGE